ncbi:hypothetical protein Q8A67_023461 [Cirrhinus molitorella]|uniref:Uncharacterized protein n=1 Tax=Cirrhinus molitorella TaxID=172907 RepID=A0AA88P3H6_9TELE|nr:hypothetical protein Q8A67_023461 [Cirrhinus molitorella]
MILPQTLQLSGVRGYSETGRDGGSQIPISRQIRDKLGSVSARAALLPGANSQSRPPSGIVSTNGSSLRPITEAFDLSPPTLEKAATPQTRKRCKLNTCLSDHQPQPFSPACLRLCDRWEEAAAFRPLLCGCTEVLRLGGGGGGGGEQLLPTQKPVSQPDRQREAASAGAVFPGALGLLRQPPQLQSRREIFMAAAKCEMDQNKSDSFLRKARRSCSR